MCRVVIITAVDKLQFLSVLKQQRVKMFRCSLQRRASIQPRATSSQFTEHGQTGACWTRRAGRSWQQLLMKKRSEETQTPHAGCSKADPMFAPPQTPLPGARDGKNLIGWRWSLPSPTNPVWRGSMHAILSYRGNRPTHKQTQPPTNRQDRLQHTVPQLVRNVKNVTYKSLEEYFVQTAKVCCMEDCPLLVQSN